MAQISQDNQLNMKTRNVDKVRREAKEGIMYLIKRMEKEERELLDEVQRFNDRQATLHDALRALDGRSAKARKGRPKAVIEVGDPVAPPLTPTNLPPFTGDRPNPFSC